MQDFLLHSIVASVVLTLLLNIVPHLFPSATKKAQRQINDKMERAFAEQEKGKKPSVRVFLPWKTMLIVSVVLTVILNLLSLF